MNRLLRGILFGGTAALALLAGSARANDVGHARPPPAPIGARVALHAARGGDEHHHVRHREFTAARRHLHRGRHGSHHRRFERPSAARRIEWGRR